MTNDIVARLNRIPDREEDYGPGNPDPRPGPYYVSVWDGPRFGILLGPCATHTEALAWVEAARRKAQEGRPFLHFAGFGTTRMRARFNKPGRLNGALNFVPTYTPPQAFTPRSICDWCGGTLDGTYAAARVFCSESCLAKQDQHAEREERSCEEFQP
jgi:hypothetical protein